MNETECNHGRLKRLCNECSLEEEVRELKIRNKKLNRKIIEINETFYGQNLKLANWHLNGALEPIDSFFENNDWSPENETGIDPEPRKKYKAYDGFNDAIYYSSDFEQNDTFFEMLMKCIEGGNPITVTRLDQL